MTERIRNRRTNEREEKQEFFNMDEGKMRNKEIIRAVRRAPIKLISSPYYLSIPPKNIRKSNVFRGCREGILPRNCLTHFSSMFHISTP